MKGIVFVIIYVVVAVSAFVCFLVSNRTNVTRQKYNNAAEQIIREDLLQYSLKNPHIHRSDLVAPTGRRLMLGVTTGSKKQQFVFDPSKNVYFGRGDQNQIIIYDREISKIQGCIFLYHHKVWMKNMSSSRGMTVSRSSSKPVRVRPGSTVRIHNKDKILINTSCLKIKLFVFDINHK